MFASRGLRPSFVSPLPVSLVPGSESGNVVRAWPNVDQGYTGEAADEAAAAHSIQLEVVKHTEAKRGFVLLPRRWVVERSFAWAARFRRLARDYERLATTLGAFHFLAFACLVIPNLFRLLA